MLDKKIEILIPKTVFLEPKQVLKDGFDAEALEMINTLKFPIIAKPRMSSIKKFSHDLLIIRDMASFLDLILNNENYSYLRKDTIVVQEYFLNH